MAVSGTVTEPGRPRPGNVGHTPTQAQRRLVYGVNVFVQTVLAVIVAIAIIWAATCSACASASE